MKKPVSLVMRNKRMIDNSYLLDLLKNSNKILDLSFSEISTILQEVKSILEKENLLLEINSSNQSDEIYVIGDIHGNLSSLKKLVNLINKKNPKYVIFLGDLVDRGPNQLECLIYILGLKILEPDRYFILRGNHETVEMNNAYGFTYDFIQKFKELEKFSEILSVYDELPICAIINRKILCLHGGIPLDKGVLKKLKGLKLKDIDQSIGQSIYQIMWNDPKEEIEGFIDSFRGPGIHFFGEDVFNEFMNENNLKFLIRAHECFLEGFKWFFNKKLLSVFTSENYRGEAFPSPASYAIIRNHEVTAEYL